MFTREPGKVGIYACGPTVYGRIHIGNARPFVVFSLLKRFLVHEGYAVTFVANITDVNDKIYAAAAGGSSVSLAEQMTAASEDLEFERAARLRDDIHIERDAGEDRRGNQRKKSERHHSRLS